MQAIITASVPVARFRAWLFTALAILLVASTASANAIYSNSVSSASPYNSVFIPLVGTVETGVQNSGRASDSGLDNFATLNTGVGVLSHIYLRLGLNGTGQVGDRAGLLVAPGSTVLNVSAVSTYTIRTYLKTGTVSQFQEARTVSAAVVGGLFGGGRPTQLEFVATLPFNEVELDVANTVALAYSLNIYYAYAVSALVQQPVRGLVSRFTAPDLTPFYDTSVTPVSPVTVCVNTVITDPQAAVDADLTNFAQFGTLVSVSCPPALSVKLEDGKTAPASYYAGFVIGGSGLLDLNVLSGLRITTYKTINGVRTMQESATGASLLDLKVLPNGQTQVSFPTTKEFDEVKIEQLAAVSVLNNLKIYYGFGVEPSAFQGTVRILSDFSAANAPSKASVTISGAICAACNVATPEGAADNDPITKATINATLGVIANVELKLALNATGNAGPAGYRAGVVASENTGLLDLSVLDQLTLTTYDASGRLLESASGSSLLTLNVLPGGKQEISFLTTQDFASVQISAASTASIGVNINVFQAFADNFAGGVITTIIPLPVELTVFAGRWSNGAAELNWATASEKNSRSFVVERSVGGDAAFRTVGQVAAAGNSSTPKTYKLRDAEASAQGVATLYYRLRQVDLDGTTAFSPVVAVAVPRLAAAPTLELYPNPAPDSRAVMVHCPNLPATGGMVQTYSQLGQLISEVPVAEAAARLPLPILTPGIYHVVLRDAAGQQLSAQRLVVTGN